MRDTVAVISRAAVGVAFAWLAMGCSEVSVARTQSAVTTEDGLLEAYSNFKRNFFLDGMDQQYTIGFGTHPLTTSRFATANGAANGFAQLNFAAGRVDATLREVPSTQAFDLWFAKNVAGTGRTVQPEPGDQFLKIGSFAPVSGGPANQQQLSVVVGSAAVSFDLDQVVVTRGGFTPDADVVAIGARTLFEKRFFRERAGGSLDPVTGTLSTSVESADPLVQRGAQLFFNETFGGNGRTCLTCHRPDNNLTIDPTFIANLPSSDPLFVAETVPELVFLEDPNLLRGHGLIRENVDGFDDPTHKFVQRGVPHTLALSTTLRRGDIPIFPSDGAPPDQRTGWSADGAPGRGTLNEFAFGAIVQHFTRTLQRRPGIDFRIPAQDELDALEAFQLFSGRQHTPNTTAITYSDPHAENGKQLVLNQAKCALCHVDLSGNDSVNFDGNNGAESLAFRTQLGLPKDGGFGTAGDAVNGFGVGRFNFPPILEAADTAPFFHNNSEATIEDVVTFYTGPEFTAAPGQRFSGTIVLTADQIADVGAFLRTINAAENIRQVRKRVQFVQSHRAPGNTDLLTFALADVQDALDELTAKNINGNTVNQLQTVQQTLSIARANDDANRVDFMNFALTALDGAKNDLFTKNPNNEF